MKLYVKYNINIVCRMVLQEQLEKLGLNYEVEGIGEIDIKEELSQEKLEQVEALFNKYGIETVTSQKAMLIQKTKDAITELVHLEDNLPTVKISAYLAEKMNHSYGYLSNLFSEVTYTSIENFIILQRVERVKQLIINGELTLTEISYKLNYSSVAHLSTQFKKTTGLTPSAFQRIIKRRQENNA